MTDGFSAEISALQEKLNLYQNEDLISLMKARLNLSARKADYQFRELKKLLLVIYLVQEKRVSLSSFQILQQMSNLDETWHLFILMTQDYCHFCNSIFGVYLHHQPELPATRLTQSSTQPPSIREQVSLVMDIWGPQTMQAWYVPPKPALSSYFQKIKNQFLR